MSRPQTVNRQSLSWRVLSIVFIGITVILTLFAVSAYFNRLNSSEDMLLNKLRTLARTTAMQIEGETHQALMDAYSVQDALTASDADPRYERIHRTLRSVYERNELNTPIYTLIPEDDHFEFGVTSSVNPYFRHRWEGHGELDRDKLFEGGEIPTYTDENGTWLTAYAPIRDNTGRPVAVVMADQKFGDFISDVRQEILTEIITAFIIGGLVIFMLYRVLKPIADREEEARRKITRAYRTIKRKQKELQESYAVIQSKNEKINQSMNYASRIQGSLLPDENELRALLPESFMFFRGKDKVSGDFPYLVRHPSGRMYLAAVDCTGHGVPGAMLSIMGYFMLNDIINARRMTEPADILNALHASVVRTLKQEDDDMSQDGMDVALITIDPQAGTVQFAGAHRPLYYLHQGELEEIKGDRLSIGGTQYSRRGKEVQFQSISMSYEDGDTLFIGSDGYQDQTGGSESKKFRAKQLREMLSQVNGHDLSQFRETVESTFDSWKGSEPQMDDVLLMGVRLRSASSG